VEFGHPSALCKRLADGELDVALVSSFEFLRNPIYRIVDDVSISSDGPVYSVVVAHRGHFSELEEIELDPASESAVNLLRCLFGELGFKPRLLQRVADVSVTVTKLSSTSCGQLLIGDQAIGFRQEYAGEFRFWDLGEHWKKLTGLPFVYALWLIRSEVAAAEKIANRLRALRDENLATVEELIAGVVAGVADRGQQKELNGEFLSRYYREHLRFTFGGKEKEGLRTFANLCVKHGLFEKRDLALNIV
jgi:chorismate dehydratase